MNRNTFDNLCGNVYERVKALLSQLLNRCKNQAFSDIVLIGGSTRIPKIQEILKNAAPHSIINKTLNADEAIARGAATLAASLAGWINF